MSHSADYAWGPVVAILADYHSTLLPEGLIERISTFENERTFSAQAYYPPYDQGPRNITTWLSTDLTIGAESFNETVVGGPSNSPSSFNPAVIHWKASDRVAFLSVSNLDFSFLFCFNYLSFVCLH